MSARRRAKNDDGILVLIGLLIYGFLMIAAGVALHLVLAPCPC